MIVSSFSDLKPEEVGQKASLLAKLAQQGIPVPKGFVFFPQEELTAEVKDQLRTAYENLSMGQEIVGVSGKALDLIRAGRGEALVAVRGNGFSRLNVKGFPALEEAMNDCLKESSGEVIIQKMVNSEKTGVVYPHPTREGSLLAEATWGLALLGGTNPDLFIIQNGQVASSLGEKVWSITRDSLTEKTIKQSVLQDQQDTLTLGQGELTTLTDLHRRVEDVLGPGYAMEFGLERSRPLVLQVRPVPFHGPATEEVEGEVVLEGEVIVPGVVRGSVKQVRHAEDLEQLGFGDIVVTRSLKPEMLKKKPAGVIVTAGSLYRLGRILDVPALRADGIGLEEGREVILDAVSGRVLVPAAKTEASPSESVTITGEAKVRLLLTSLEQPPAEEIVVKSETILTEKGNPTQFAREQPQEVIQFLSERLESLARTTFPKAVWYRGFDGRSDELQGFGEEREAQPLLGKHGIRRVEEPLFQAELEALAKVYEHGLHNLTLLLPFVSRAEEVRAAKEKIRFPLKLGVTVETPSAALQIEELCREGIFGVLVDLDSLIQLTLGVDIDNPSFATLFSQLEPSVKALVKGVVETCKKYRIEVAVMGEGVNHAQVIEQLKEMGVSSFVADPDSRAMVQDHVSREVTTE